MLTKDVRCVFITGADFIQVLNLDQHPHFPHHHHHCTVQNDLILIQSVLEFTDKWVTSEVTRRPVEGLEMMKIFRQALQDL